MPVFSQHGTVFEIHLFWGLHPNIGFDFETKFTAGPGKDIIHCKGMQCWNKYFFHSVLRSFTASDYDQRG
jgi:hypothetical protein